MVRPIFIVFILWPIKLFQTARVKRLQFNEITPNVNIYYRVFLFNTVQDAIRPLLLQIFNIMRPGDPCTCTCRYRWTGTSCRLSPVRYRTIHYLMATNFDHGLNVLIILNWRVELLINLLQDTRSYRIWYIWIVLECDGGVNGLNHYTVYQMCILMYMCAATPVKSYLFGQCYSKFTDI